ncbi:aspartate carbamoyltransferase catalytic subunit [Aciditerrimonas ferrireducens]|uniref:Aspartate carbamoyltransferase n=1 Tax=Aciditerrimonas ferrireducens TaxID=667306 RepID=A0ABV6C463_9ACTN
MSPSSASPAARWDRRHLLSVADLSRDDLVELLTLSERFAEVGRRPIPKVPALRGRTVGTVFVEASTRTRLSFETAARRLSADVLSFTASSSSLTKGESLRDTVRTIEALGVDCVVVRHGCAGVPTQVARWLGDRVAVVNGGDGWHEHPTQALLDVSTLQQALAARAGVPVEEAGVEGFAGLRVAIVGDVGHSRVARSLVGLLAVLGAKVTVVAPGSLLPASLEGWPLAGVSHDLDAVLGDLDVCYLLRLQTERGAGRFLPSLREYRECFGLSAARAARLGPDAVVLHPGPMVRGVEIAEEVCEDPRCLVLQQVETGVAVRMAVLYQLLTPGESEEVNRG